MNKEELSKLVAELLQDMGKEPTVKASDYKPTAPNPQPAKEDHHPGDFVEDVTKVDLRKLYLQEKAKDPEAFCKLKAKTPARLGSGRAGHRYKTLTMLRFRADHAAAQDAVFSQVPEDFAEKNGLLPLQTCCENKDQYLTRPDLGRKLNEESQKRLRTAISQKPRVQIVIGDGLSSAAILANGLDCMAAIRDGLKVKGIETGQAVFIRYCRVGAGDAVGDITDCDVVCVLVGERQGLVTDKSMSAYITYKPKSGIPEASRTVVSNIHDQGTPAVEAGAFVAELIDTILKRQKSGVALQMEGIQ